MEDQPHHHTITPLIINKELTEFKTEVLCISTQALLQKMEQVSQSVLAKYNDDKIGFKIECLECEALYYFIDGILYDKNKKPKMKSKPIDPYKYHLN